MWTISRWSSLGLWQYKVTEKTNFNKVFLSMSIFRCEIFFFGLVSSIYLRIWTSDIPNGRSTLSSGSLSFCLAYCKGYFCRLFQTISKCFPYTNLFQYEVYVSNGSQNDCSHLTSLSHSKEVSERTAFQRTLDNGNRVIECSNNGKYVRKDIYRY